MIRSVVRPAVTAALGAMLGVMFVVAFYARDPAFDLSMETDLSAIGTGFYPTEHDGTHAFAWTMREADLSLAGLDRRVSWACSVRFRGARPNDAIPQPRLTLSADGQTGSVFEATNEFSEARIAVPPRGATPGLTLSLTSSSVMVPGPSDPRSLGVQVDRIACSPSGAGIAWPPAAAMRTAAIGGGAFGAALAGIGIPIVAALAGTVIVSAAQALVLTVRLVSCQSRRLRGLDRRPDVRLGRPPRGDAETAPHPRCSFRGRVLGGIALPEADCTGSTVQTADRCRVSRAPFRVGAGWPVLLHAVVNQRNPFPIRHRAVPVCRTLVVAHARLRDAAPRGGVRD
jgi:hypothetical protein